MHINHLIWDRIFADPEFGIDHDIDVDTDDELTEIYNLYIWNVICSNSNPNIFIKSNSLRYETCRGICVRVPRDQNAIVVYPYIPNLQLSSSLCLSKMQIIEFQLSVQELENEMMKMTIPTSTDGNVDIKYLESMFANVLDSLRLYQMDSCVLDLGMPKIFYELYSKLSIEVMDLYTRLKKFKIDQLKEMSIHINRAFNLSIKIFQIHHETMVPILIKHYKNPLRPRYCAIYDLIRKRIHSVNRCGRD